ncbi:hypothetical protein V6N13_057422 [Hibiscus sabdariffa]
MGLALVGMAEDRSKATLPLTIPRRVFKSSAKDSTRRSVEITLQGGTHDLSDARATPTTRALGGHRPLLRVGNRATGACIASSPDSDLEAFSHNPAHGSFTPLAFQPSAMTNCANQRSKGSIGHAFTVRIHTGNQNQTSFFPFVPHEISVLVELILGQLRYLLTDVPPKPNSPPDNVFRPDRLTVPSPQSQSFSRGYGSILLTSLAYIVPSTRGCSPWRPDAVMSTTGRGWRSVLRIFKGRRGRTGHHATCGALPAAGPYLRLSRFQGGQAVKQKR